MTPSVEALHQFQLELDRAEVLRLQGYRQGMGSASAEVMGLVDQAVEQALRLAQPRAVYAVFDMAADDGVALPGGQRLLQAGVPRQWRGLERLALAVCTIGPGLENRVSRLFADGDLALAAMLDSAASVAVENVADQVNRAICSQARQWHLEAGPRLSPGYGRWALEEQRTIFNVLPPASIGVELTEGLMMRPEKSISFGVGLGQRLVADNSNVCRRCGMASCQFRRTGGEHG